MLQSQTSAPCRKSGKDKILYLTRPSVMCVCDCCTRGLLVESKLLSFSANISRRLFPQWAVRVLNLPALPKGELYQTHDPIEVTVSGAVCESME